MTTQRYKNEWAMRKRRRLGIPARRTSPLCTKCGGDKASNFYRRKNRHVIQPCKICYSKRVRTLPPEQALKHNERVKRYLLGEGAPVRRAWLDKPENKLAHSLRQRVRSALSKGAKSSTTFKLVGCSLEFLIGYLEARSKPGMSWKNYGTVWEIDHRIPCSSYDLTDPSHQRSCFHYSNLQPLFSRDNRSKGAKLPASHQAELI